MFCRYGDQNVLLEYLETALEENLKKKIRIEPNFLENSNLIVFSYSSLLALKCSTLRPKNDGFDHFCVDLVLIRFFFWEKFVHHFFVRVRNMHVLQRVNRNTCNQTLGNDCTCRNTEE